MSYRGVSRACASTVGWCSLYRCMIGPQLDLDFITGSQKHWGYEKIQFESAFMKTYAKYGCGFYQDMGIR